jgi:D-tyrosyl-tRNA(Tyr) deacylase
VFAIVVSAVDPASVNIAARLRSLAHWDTKGEFLGKPVLWSEPFAMVEIPDLHIYHEGLDAQLRSQAGLEPEVIIFASKHKAASGQRTLTVHPVGNFGEARFGGQPNQFTPAAPRHQSHALRALAIHAKEAGVSHGISFEATHHGPLLNTPAFFIELGSGEQDWGDARAAEVVARAILDVPSAPRTLHVIGLGGGHYAPKHTDLARRRLASVGHIVPDHALEGGISDELVFEAARRSQAKHFHLDVRGHRAEPMALRLEAAGLKKVSAEQFPEA